MLLTTGTTAITSTTTTQARIYEEKKKRITRLRTRLFLSALTRAHNTAQRSMPYVSLLSGSFSYHV